MKKLVVFVVSLICLFQDLHAQDIVPLCDISIVYKDDPYEKVASPPLYRWFCSRQRLLQMTASIFDACKRDALSLTDVACDGKEYDIKVHRLKSEIFKCSKYPKI